MRWSALTYFNFLGKLELPGSNADPTPEEIELVKRFPNLQNGTWSGAGELAIFGDAKVDIPMFECCALSVCMGSGGEEAKAAADYVTADVDDDGLYKAFVHLGLID